MTYHLDSEANIGINDLIYGKADVHEKYYHGVPEGGQKQKKLPGYDTYIF